MPKGGPAASEPRREAPRARGPVRGRNLAAAALSLSLALACTPRETPVGRLRVAVLRQPATSLYFVARAGGCFERERLELEERTFDLGRDAVALLRADGADVAVAYETVVVRAFDADPRLRVIGTLHHATRNTRLVTRAAAGISSFADLAGKRVAVPRGTNADFFVGLVLRFGAVDRARVEIVDLAPPAAAEALAAGDVDAAVLWDPVATRAERALGADARVLSSEIYAEFSLLTTRADVLERRTPALRALLRGLVCGERYARERPDETMRELRRVFPDLDEPALREQLARVTWVVGADNLLLDVLHEEHRWAAAAAGRETAGPLEPLLAPGLLEEVDPEAVMLLPATGGAR